MNGTNWPCCQCGYPIHILESDLKRMEANPVGLEAINKHLAEPRYTRNRYTGEIVDEAERIANRLRHERAFDDNRKR